MNKKYRIANTKLLIFLFAIFLMGGLFQLEHANTFAADGDSDIVVGSTTEYPATADGLNKAIHDISDGGTISIEGDILADHPIYIFGSLTFVRNPAFSSQKLTNKDFTINGNGHTITADYNLLNITSSSNPNYATAGQDDWGMQGVVSIAEFGGHVTLKDLTLDANKKTGEGAWIYRTGDPDHSIGKDGLVTLDSVTLKNGKAVVSRGGYGAIIDTSVVKAINPITSGNDYFGFNVDLMKYPSAASISKLEIEGISIYDEISDEVENHIEGAGHSNYVNIVCEKKPGVTIIDNGTEYKVSDYIENGGAIIGSHPNAALNPTSLPSTEDEYKVYLPQTLDSYQYNIHYKKRFNWSQWKNVTYVFFGQKPAKIKSDKFSFEKNIKYHWDLEKTGKLTAQNIPKYTVKAIAKEKEQYYQLSGKAYVKNFREEHSNDIFVTATLLNDNGVVMNSEGNPITKELSSFTLKPGEEKELAIEFEIENMEQVTENNAKIKLDIHEKKQIDRTIFVPIDKMSTNEIDKTIEVIDDKFTFKPSFMATWSEGETFEQKYTMEEIKEKFTNTASITFEDNTKIEKSVTLTPTSKPIPKHKTDTNKGTPDTGHTTWTLPVIGLLLISMGVIVRVKKNSVSAK